VGLPVLRLVRVRIGPLRLGRMMPGEVRPLASDEVRALAQAAGM
jgi:23S rRNA pseudouridine2605 synthase